MLRTIDSRSFLDTLSTVVKSGIQVLIYAGDADWVRLYPLFVISKTFTLTQYRSVIGSADLRLRTLLIMMAHLPSDLRLSNHTLLMALLRVPLRLLITSAGCVCLVPAMRSRIISHKSHSRLLSRLCRSKGLVLLKAAVCEKSLVGSEVHEEVI